MEFQNEVLVRVKRILWTMFMLLAALSFLYVWQATQQWPYVVGAIFCIMYAVDISVYIFFAKGSIMERRLMVAAQALQCLLLVGIYILQLMPWPITVVMFLATVRTTYQAYKKARD